MYTKNDSIRKLIEKNRVLIAAHRGTCGGNVVQNTSLSYQNALLHGADMIEIDAAMTTDGGILRLPTMEKKKSNLASQRISAPCPLRRWMLCIP